MAICLLGLGSNLGDRTANLQQAVRLLGTDTGRLLAQSTMLETSPVGGPQGQPKYLNVAAVLETDRSPLEVLAELQRIEQQLGRQRIERWGPRSLDLDLLLYDQCILDSPTLVVPHPRLPFRRFVLAPAAEIAAEMIHPTTGFSILELLARLNDRPIHVAVVGIGASTIARSAAIQTGGVLLERPGMNAAGSFSPAKTLEFLRQGVRDWDAALAKNGCAVISEFWIGEVWTESDDAGASQAWSEIQAAWRALPVRLPAPHLVLWLEAMNEEMPDRMNRLRRFLFRPRQFPVLTYRGVDVDSAVAEIVAAVEAME